MTCSRLTSQIATLLALYPHLTKRDLSELRRYHCCGECRPLTERHLSREPERPE